MRPARLVLVRWHDDIIATQTLGKNEAPHVSALPADAPVTLEVLDLSTSRASFRGPVELRPLLLVLGSVAAHAVLGALLLATSLARSPDDVERERIAALRSYATKLAVSHNEPTPEIHVAEDADSAATSGPSTTASATPAVASSSHAQRVRPHRQTGMKGGDARLASAPAVCAAHAQAASTGPMCSRTVVVRSLTRSTPSCFTDSTVSVGERGTLTFPCSGDGAATITFPHASFEGADDEGKLSVCTGTQFAWADGCTWTSAQTVTGAIESGTLRFTYGEAPKGGRVCASACSATGSVEVR